MYSKATVPRYNKQIVHERVGKTIAGLKNNSIRDIYFVQGEKITTGQIKAICNALKKNTSLKTLYLEYQNISSEGIIAVTDMLKVNCHLTDLTLRHSTGLNDQGIISALMKNNTIKRLNFINSKLDDTAALALAKVLNDNKSLQSINLMWNYITDIGAQALAESLVSNQSLCELELRENYITTASIPYFEKMLKQNIYLVKLEIDIQRREKSTHTEEKINTGSIGELLKENLVAKDNPVAQANLLALRNSRGVNVPSLLDIGLFAIKRYIRKSTIPIEFTAELPDHLIQRLKK